MNAELDTSLRPWNPGDQLYMRRQGSVRVARQIVQLIPSHYDNLFSPDRAYRWSPDVAGDGDWSWLR